MRPAKENRPKRPPKTERRPVVIYLDKSLYNDVMGHARLMNRTASSVIEEALAKHRSHAFSQADHLAGKRIEA